MQGAGKDTKRVTTEDIVPEGAAGDADYQKAVQQLEDQQHGRAGWLSARGAFDKGDQAYMRDQEEQARHLEEAMADRELQQFAAARRRAEQEEELKRQRAASSAAALLVKKKADQKRVYREALAHLSGSVCSFLTGFDGKCPSRDLMKIAVLYYLITCPCMLNIAGNGLLL